MTALSRPRPVSNEDTRGDKKTASKRAASKGLKGGRLPKVPQSTTQATQELKEVKWLLDNENKYLRKKATSEISQLQSQLDLSERANRELAANLDNAEEEILCHQETIHQLASSQRINEAALQGSLDAEILKSTQLAQYLSHYKGLEATISNQSLHNQALEEANRKLQLQIQEKTASLDASESVRNLLQTQVDFLTDSLTVSMQTSENQANDLKLLNIVMVDRNTKLQEISSYFSTVSKEVSRLQTNIELGNQDLNLHWF